MAELITVVARDKTERVVLWEKLPEHPDGEIFVVCDGQHHTVALTRRVRWLLDDGVLVKVEQPAEAESDAPWDDYDDMTAAQIVEQMAGLDSMGVAKVKAYEVAHKNRKTILEA